MRFLGLSLAISAIAALASLKVREAEAVTYSFTKIADNSTTVSESTLDAAGLGKAAVSGTNVAFQACYNGSGGAGCGIFTGNGGALTTIVKDGTPAPAGTFSSNFGTFAHPPSISGNIVAFYADYQFNMSTFEYEKAGIFTGSGGPLTTIQKTGDAAPSGTFNSFKDAAISGSNVAFQANYGANLQGVFSSSGGPLTTIARSNDMVPPVGALTGFKAPSISGSTVAFEADYSGGQGILTGSGGTPSIVAKSGDMTPSGGTFNTSGFFEPSISGSNVAFRASFSPAGANGIFKWNGSTLTTIVKTGDSAPVGTISLLTEPSISDNIVAFVGRYSTNKRGLFVGSGGALTTVIKQDDLLFGQTVTSVEFDRFGLDPSGSGNLAFKYTLSNGATGVALAVAGGPPAGDYNLNGIVDAADYVVWRDTENQFVTPGTGADGDYSGKVDVVDYVFWKARFGNQAEPGSGSAVSASIGAVGVPEPGAWELLSFGAMSFVLLWRRARSRRPL